MKKSLYTFFAVVLFSTFIFAAAVKKEHEIVEIDGADKVILKGELGAGEFNFTTSDMSDAFSADISYAPRELEYWVDAETKSNKRYIDIGCKLDNDHDFDIEENTWEIVLSEKYPIEINLAIGACESDIDFGALPLEELVIDYGASDAEILFSKRNPVRCKEINIDAGASSLNMHEIGNANFEYFKLDGGAGSFDLDFLGDYEGTSYIDIEIGLGSADLVLPKNVAVQINTDGDGMFSSVDIHSNSLDEVDDDTYESEDFDTAKNKIIVNISVGMGSVDIRFHR